MSTINLNPDGLYDWTLDTTPDSFGNLELWVAGDTGNRSIWLDMATLMTLRDIFDSITSKCRCKYVASKTISEEYDRYMLTKTNPYCPFHGEK